MCDKDLIKGLKKSRCADERIDIITKYVKELKPGYTSIGTMMDLEEATANHLENHPKIGKSRWIKGKYHIQGES